MKPLQVTCRRKTKSKHQHVAMKRYLRGPSFPLLLLVTHAPFADAFTALVPGFPCCPSSLEHKRQDARSKMSASLALCCPNPEEGGQGHQAIIFPCNNQIEGRDNQAEYNEEGQTVCACPVVGVECIPANLWIIVLSSGSAQERMLANGCMLHTQSASSDT